MTGRRPRHPLVALGIVALTGVVVLEGSWLAFDALADDGPQRTAAQATEASAALATPLLSVRRAPSALSRSASSAELERALAPLLGIVGDRSCVQVALDGRTVAAKHETIGVIPGSNEKLPIAAAALEVLGRDHVFTTKVSGVVGPDASVVGDLALIGGGDPLLATEWYPDSAPKYPQRPATRLEDLADAVVAAGVRSVTGSVVGDESRYDTERYAPFWDASLQKTDVGPLSALMVNDDSVSAGQVKVDDPALAAAQLLAQLLRARGVTIANDSRVATAPAGAATIASVASAPLGDILAEMLANSDNNTAELLVKELGFARGGAGTRAAGLTVARDALVALGLPVDGVVLQDGSGLGRGNQLTCAFLGALLARYGLADPIPAGMAVAGTTGTLGPEFTTSPVRGRLRAKTGSLAGVKSLSGYLPVDGGAGGRGATIEFALVLNAPAANDVAYYRPIWESRLAKVLATYPSGPTADQLAPPAAGGA